MSADDILNRKPAHPEKIAAVRRGLKGAVGIEAGPRASDDREVVARVDGIPLRADDFAAQLAHLMNECAQNDARVINALVERLAIAMVGYIKSPRFDAMIRRHLDAGADTLIANYVAKNAEHITEHIDKRVSEQWPEKVEQGAQQILESALREVKKRYAGVGT